MKEIKENLKKNSPKFSSIKDIGISYDPNPQFRPSMEVFLHDYFFSFNYFFVKDEYLFIDNFDGIPGQGYFAIYDGHNGREVVEYVSKKLHKNLSVKYIYFIYYNNF